MSFSLSNLTNLNPLSTLSNAIESTCDAILPKQLEFVGDIAGMVADIRTGNYLKLTDDLQDLLKDLPQQLSTLAKKRGQGSATGDCGEDLSANLEPTPPPSYSTLAIADGDALLAPSDDINVDDDGLLAPTDEPATKNAAQGTDSPGTAQGGGISRDSGDSTTTSATGPSTPLKGRAKIPPRVGFGAPPEGGSQARLQRGRPPGGASRGATPPGDATMLERKISVSTGKPSASESSAKSSSSSKTAAAKTNSPDQAEKASKAAKGSDSAASGTSKTSTTAKPSTSSKAAGSTAAKTGTVSASMTADAFFKLSDKDLMNAIRDGKIPASVTKDPEQMRRLQVRMNDITQMNQMITSILAALHEMNKQVIQNLRV